VGSKIWVCAMPWDPKKQPNTAETSIRSVHCNHGINADANVG